ncbi:MAG: hypothetical protein AAF414_12935 [Pseudomonadota bacterium]
MSNVSALPLSPEAVARVERVHKLRPGPTPAQLSWLSRGLDQPGGKLPLFDWQGQKIEAKLVLDCIKAGWAERWFHNPLKPDWQVCRLTAKGRAIVSEAG